MTSKFGLIQHQCCNNDGNNHNDNRNRKRSDIACTDKLPFFCNNTHRRTAGINFCKSSGDIHGSQCNNEWRNGYLTDYKSVEITDYITNPLKTPITTPTLAHAMSATAIGSSYLDTHPAAITPERSMIDPTERSIPPRIITMVIAHAISILVEICRRILNIFWVDKNEL